MLVFQESRDVFDLRICNSKDNKTLEFNHVIYAVGKMVWSTCVWVKASGFRTFVFSMFLSFKFFYQCVTTDLLKVLAVENINSITGFCYFLTSFIQKNNGKILN